MQQEVIILNWREDNEDNDKKKSWDNNIMWT